MYYLKTVTAGAVLTVHIFGLIQRIKMTVLRQESSANLEQIIPAVRATKKAIYH